MSICTILRLYEKYLHMVQSIHRSENNANNLRYNTKMIPKYNILVNGIHKECNVLGWKTAHAHAKNYLTNLFETNKVEILTLATGEITEIKA